MATPQELQNALMLKKANPNLTTEQAVNQARVPVTATSQINQDQLAQNQASRQAIPVTPTPVAPSVQEQMAGKTVAERQAVRNAMPEPAKTEQDINKQLG